VKAHRSAAVLAASESSRQTSQRDAGATDGVTVRSRGHLPHWEQGGATYFVTFRLADSLPQSALKTIEFERSDIVKTAKQQGRELTPVEQSRLDKLFSDRIEEYLDGGEGACHLVRPEIAKLVAEALWHFDGGRYALLAWCVMPNHVHVVFQPSTGYPLADILHSWKSFTAKRANQILKRTGNFWQREYYDHLVRDAADLDRIVWYVAGNPARADLKDWPWVWTRSAAVPAASVRGQRDAGATGSGGDVASASGRQVGQRDAGATLKEHK